MNVRFKNTFLKDLKRRPADAREKVEQLVFQTIPLSSGINELASVKKLKGFERFHRIRIGDFRLGSELRGNEVIVYRVLRRSDIYRYFP